MNITKQFHLCTCDFTKSVLEVYKDKRFSKDKKVRLTHEEV